MNTAPSEPKQYFPALTGLRAVAALLVFVHHFNPFSVERVGWTVHTLAAELHIGVTVFFVLSGFLIGYRYLGVEQLSWRAYFANRFARIYPLYFLLTTATFGLFYYLGRDTADNLLEQYVLNITFLRGLFQQYLYTGIAQGWSLTTEEMFYVSAPLAFVLVRRSAHWLWALPLLLAAVGVALVLAGRPQPWHGFFDSLDFLFQFVYLGRAAEFFTGVALAWWLRQRGRQQLPVRGLTYVGVVGMLACIGALSLLHGPGEFEFGVMQPAGMFINNIVLPLVGIGPLLWGLVQEDTVLRRLLSSAPLVLLGKSSYAFYLIHIGVFQQLLYEATGSQALCVLLLYVASILLYWLLEEPLNQWLRRVVGKPNHSAVATQNTPGVTISA
ncbi:acyltransferase family protein [Hymenobacter puniceus]|uniref:acyltransferase family protein n=1 Tax=Hymenobacter sp. BT190 TaxID=2763505 RepID=UPI0016514B5E|nr:acyltransferase [Hymenobacter sp. BT190]MBC6697106.1 acyltransferase [Hymenobacter sp. BT190]